MAMGRGGSERGASQRRCTRLLRHFLGKTARIQGTESGKEVLGT